MSDTERLALRLTEAIIKATDAEHISIVEYRPGPAYVSRPRFARAILAADPSLFDEAREQGAAEERALADRLAAALEAVMNEQATWEQVREVLAAYRAARAATVPPEAEQCQHPRATWSAPCPDCGET